MELPGCGWRGWGAAESNLASRLSGIEQVCVQGKIAPRFEQERGEEGQRLDGFDEIAARQQLPKYSSP